MTSKTDKTAPEAVSDSDLDQVQGGGVVPTEEVTLNYTETEWTYAKADTKVPSQGVEYQDGNDLILRKRPGR